MAGWWDSIKSNEPPAPAAVPTADWWGALNTGSVPGGQSIGSTDKSIPSEVIEDPRRMARVPTQAAASLPTDEMARVRYYASQRFPDVSPEKAMENYFYKDNRLAYRGSDGKAYYEEPKLRAPTSLSDLSQDAKAVATGAGPALPMVGGVLGGLTALAEGPPGWFSGVPQSAAGGAGGDIVRQILAGTITGEDKPITARALQTTGAAAEQGLGQMLGNTVSLAMRALGRTPTYNIPETTALRDSSDRWGISLTPGEETGNRTLLRRQKILANTTEGEQPFTDFYTGRNDQVRGAVNSLLGDLSPNVSPRMASAAGVEGAGQALKQSQKELSALTRPYYERAIDNNPQRFWSPEAESLFERPSMQDAIGAAKKLAKEEGRTLTVPTFENGKRVGDEIVPDWRSWDYMKKALDGIVDAETNDAGRVSQYGRSVIQTREKLLGILDKANPEYSNARGAFKGGVPARAALEKGVVGDAAKLEGNDVLRAGNIIFGKGSSPEDVRLAREAFDKAGAIDKWDALARSHLEQVFNEIPDSATGSITNIGGSFRKAVLGNERKRQIMEATFEHRPEFWGDLMDLSKVLDATGRAMKGESITAFAQAGQKELAREGQGVLPSVIETVEFWKTPSRISRYVADLNSSKYAAKQAELFTTPEGRATLRELKRLGPTSAGAVMTLSHFLTGAGLAGASDALEPVKNGPVISESRLGPMR